MHAAALCERIEELAPAPGARPTIELPAALADLAELTEVVRQASEELHVLARTPPAGAR